MVCSVWKVHHLAPWGLGSVVPVWMQRVNHGRQKPTAFDQIMEHLSRCCNSPLKSSEWFDPHINIFIFYSPVTCTDFTSNITATVVKSRFGFGRLRLTSFESVAAPLLLGEAPRLPWIVKRICLAGECNLGAVRYGFQERSPRGWRVISSQRCLIGIWLGQTQTSLLIHPSRMNPVTIKNMKKVNTFYMWEQMALSKDQTACID